MLSLTCAVFQQKQAFYSKRSKLYEECLELLLEQWDKTREIERDEIYRDLSVERKLELLSCLAVKKFEKPQYVLFEQEEIEDYITEFLEIGKRDSRAVLRAIESQHGLLIERSRTIWSFSHLTFQEYLIAKAGMAYFNSAKQEATNSSILQHTTRKNWREVFRMMSEILDEPDSLLLSIKVFADSLLANDSKLQEFLTWLDEKSKSIKSSHQLNAIRALYLARALHPRQLGDGSESDLFQTFRTLARALDLKVSDSSEADLTVDRLVFYLLEEVTLSDNIRATIRRIKTLTTGRAISF